MSLTKIELSQLLEIYGQLVTENQRDIVAMYCDCDCTLSEIAQEKNITRQSVRDSILKAESTLQRFEETLHLAEFSHSLNSAILENDNAKIVAIAKKFVQKE